MTEATEAHPALPETCPLDLAPLSDALKKHVAADAGLPFRMAAAKGMAPMPPHDLVTAQYALLWDENDKVRTAAEKSLGDLDPRLANAVLGDTKVPPPVLSHLASVHTENDAYLEKLLLNPKLPAEAVVVVAGSCSERIVSDHIVTNQARLLEKPEIARSLAHNPAALKSDRERVVDFLVRNGKMVEGLHDFEEALLRLNGEERVEAAARVDIPKEIFDDRFLSPEEREALKERRLITEEEEDEEDGEPTEDDRTVEQKWRSWTVSQKVAAATLGNKAIRTMAMREPNRMIAVAAITSPAITEQEVVAAAASKTVHADVLNHILRDRKNNWVRNYQVKLALVNNPKTKLPDAMKLVPTLNGRDLRAVAKSRNVPAGVRNMAAKIVKAKTR